jgi:hypothetical protein
LTTPTPALPDRRHCQPGRAVVSACLLLLSAAASAQLSVQGNPLSPRPATAERDARPQGGLYIAGDGFSFEQAAERAMRQNPHGQRFFLLSLPPETAALTNTAQRQQTRVRQRVLAAGGVLLVCQRDVDQRRIDATAMVREVAAVRGFPPSASALQPGDRRYFDDEDRSRLPAANEALRTLRSTCS